MGVDLESDFFLFQVGRYNYRMRSLEGFPPGRIFLSEGGFRIAQQLAHRQAALSHFPGLDCSSAFQPFPLLLLPETAFFFVVRGRGNPAPAACPPPRAADGVACPVPGRGVPSRRPHLRPHGGGCPEFSFQAPVQFSTSQNIFHFAFSILRFYSIFYFPLPFLSPFLSKTG